MGIVKIQKKPCRILGKLSGQGVTKIMHFIIKPIQWKWNLNYVWLPEGNSFVPNHTLCSYETLCKVAFLTPFPIVQNRSNYEIIPCTILKIRN